MSILNTKYRGDALVAHGTGRRQLGTLDTEQVVPAGYECGRDAPLVAEAAQVVGVPLLLEVEHLVDGLGGGHSSAIGGV